MLARRGDQLTTSSRSRLRMAVYMGEDDGKEVEGLKAHHVCE